MLGTSEKLQNEQDHDEIEEENDSYSDAPGDAHVQDNDTCTDCSNKSTKTLALKDVIQMLRMTMPMTASEIG